MAELVNQSLRSFRLLHDAFLVVLPYGSRQFVVIHGRSILATSPETGNAYGVFDLEHSLRSIQPSDCSAVQLWIGQQFFEELPKMNVCSALASGFGGRQDDGSTGSGWVNVRRCGGSGKQICGRHSDRFG